METSRLQEVKKRVTIPAYFYNIILPQLPNYYNDYTVDFDNKAVVKCCLHDEDTPSMRYFDETNTFFCYGCRAGGDIVELHRKFTSKMTGTWISLDESVDFLYNYFIKGNSNQQVVTSTKEVKEFMSTVSEVVRLSGYCSKLERQLSADTSIDEKVKEIIWDALDNINILVSTNSVNAIAGMNHIKNVVRNNVK